MGSRSLVFLCLAAGCALDEGPLLPRGPDGGSPDADADADSDGDGDSDGDVDADADGDGDADMVCQPGETRPCGIDTGECSPGIERCWKNRWTGVCDDPIGPRAERCNGLDENCNDLPDQDDPAAMCDREESCGEYQDRIVCYYRVAAVCSDDPCPSDYQCGHGSDGWFGNCDLCENDLCACTLCIRAP